MNSRYPEPDTKQANNQDDNIIKKVKSGELNWDDLVIAIKLEDSIIEYVDSYEQNNAMIVMT